MDAALNQSEQNTPTPLKLIFFSVSVAGVLGRTQIHFSSLRPQFQASFLEILNPGQFEKKTPIRDSIRIFLRTLKA